MRPFVAAAMIVTDHLDWCLAVAYELIKVRPFVAAASIATDHLDWCLAVTALNGMIDEKI